MWISFKATKQICKYVDDNKEDNDDANKDKDKDGNKV